MILLPLVQQKSLFQALIDKGGFDTRHYIKYHDLDDLRILDTRH